MKEGKIINTASEFSFYQDNDARVELIIQFNQSTTLHQDHSSILKGMALKSVDTGCVMINNQPVEMRVTGSDRSTDEPQTQLPENQPEEPNPPASHLHLDEHFTEPDDDQTNPFGDALEVGTRVEIDHTNLPEETRKKYNDAGCLTEFLDTHGAVGTIQRFSKRGGVWVFLDSPWDGETKFPEECLKVFVDMVDVEIEEEDPEQGDELYDPEQGDEWEDQDEKEPLEHMQTETEPEAEDAALDVEKIRNALDKGPIHRLLALKSMGLTVAKARAILKQQV